MQSRRGDAGPRCDWATLTCPWATAEYIASIQYFCENFMGHRQTALYGYSYLFRFRT